jgi:hypothetical protein
MGSSLENLGEGSVGQPGVGSSNGDLESWLNGALELNRSSVKGTWKEESLAGDPEEYVEKALDLGISFHRHPDGEYRRGLIY